MTARRRILPRALLLAALLPALLGCAQSVAGDRPGAHGGRIADIGPVEIELLVGPERVDAYLFDHHGRPLPAHDYLADATFSRIRRFHRRVILRPDGGDRLSASVHLPPGTTLALWLTLQTRSGEPIGDTEIDGIDVPSAPVP